MVHEKELIFFPCTKRERPYRKTLRALKTKMHKRTLRTEDTKALHQNVKNKTKKQKTKTKVASYHTLKHSIMTWYVKIREWFFFFS